MAHAGSHASEISPDLQGDLASGHPAQDLTPADSAWLPGDGDEEPPPGFPVEVSQSLPASSVHGLDDSFHENSLQWATEGIEQAFDEPRSESEEDRSISQDGQGVREVGDAEESSYQISDGLLFTSFQRHELPLGLVLDWSKPLPVVTGVHPGSYAEAHPEIMPGLVILAINEVEVPQGAPAKDVEELFKQRPLSIVFDCSAVPGMCLGSSEAPNVIYQVGECYRAISRVLMRRSEALDSEIVAECLAGAVLEVVQRGIGMADRRLMVAAAGRIGWVSCMTSTGEVLLATKPALLIPRSPLKNAQIDDAQLLDNVEPGSQKSNPWDKAVMAKVEREESPEKRKERRAKLLGQAANKPVDREEPEKRRKSDQEQGSALSRGMHSLCACISGSIISVVSMLTCGNASSRSVHDDDDSSSSDGELTQAELEAATGHDQMAKLHSESKRKAQMEMLRKQSKVWADDFAEDHSLFARCKRRCGVERMMLKIKVMRLRREAEGPYFPAVADLCADLRFEMCVGLTIIVNAYFIALETFYEDSRPPILDAAEHVFTALFFVEWCIRVSDGLALYFLNAVNLFDTFLVWITGVVVMWILSPAGIDAQSLRRIGALRLLRLCRLVRAVRMIPLFKDLWMLVSGIVNCASLLCWCMILGSVMMYTFAVACLELIAKNPQFADDEVVQFEFGSLTEAMFTLFQIMTFDSWAKRVKPITNADPKTALLFFIFMGLCGIVLFNLMTAIVVRNAFEAASGDEEAVNAVKMQRAHKVKTELLEIFADLDEDRSGKLSKEEFLDCLDDFAFVRKMKMLDIEIDELPDIFEILDDGDGQVDQNEFVTGMMQLQGVAMGSEMLKGTALMASQNVHFTALEDSFVENALETFRTVDKKVDEFHEHMNEVILLSTEIVHKLDRVGLRKVHRGTMNALNNDVPFIEDPTVEEIQRSEKKHAKAQRKAKRKNDHSADKDEHPEGFVKRIIPPEWFVREGKSPAAKNAGKTKLLRNPELKERLVDKQKALKRAKEKPVITGIPKEFAATWETLDMRLDQHGTLATGDPSEDHPPCPLHFNFLPQVMAGGPRPEELQSLHPPKSHPVMSAPVLPPSGAPPHPHTVPEGDAPTMPGAT